MPAWKRMSSGKYIDLMDLKETDLNIQDIDTSLNNIIRFTGHWKDRRPLTVAQHSYLCLLLAQEREPEDYKLHLACFVHDFAEAYIGDVATPVKKAMGNFWYDFAGPIEALVEKKFYGSPFDPDIKSRVKLYDSAALDIERRHMWRSQYGKAKWPVVLLDVGTLDEKSDYFDSAVWDTDVPLTTIWRELVEFAFPTQE